MKVFVIFFVSVMVSLFFIPTVAAQSTNVCQEYDSEITVIPNKKIFYPQENMTLSVMGQPNETIDLIIENPKNKNFFDTVKTNSTGNATFTYPLGWHPMKGTWKIITNQDANIDIIFLGVYDKPQRVLTVHANTLMHSQSHTAKFTIAGNPQQSLNLDVTNSLKQTVFHDELTLDSNGLCVYSLTLKDFSSGVYDLAVSDKQISDNTSFAVGLQPYDPALETVSDPTKPTKHDVLKLEQDGKLIPPLNQINLGVQPDQVKCNEGLVLLQKYDGSPACVTESTKQKLIERGWTEKKISESKPEPEQATAPEMKLREAKDALEKAYFNTVNVGSFYIKDVIVGFGTYDNTLVIDIPSKYIGTHSMDTIKQDIRHIVGNDVPIDYVLYDESIARFIPTVMPYIWNQVLNQKGIEYVPKNQTYWNNGDGFADHDKVCSPIVASNGTELYISTTFDLEPFQITGTHINKKEPSDCHKTWKTDVILTEPDRITALWLKNQMIENED